VIALVSASVLSSALAAVPGEAAAWSVVRDDIVRVECTTVAGEPWCRSVGTISAGIDAVDQTLSQIERSYVRFDKLLSATKLDAATRHVTIDYPSILSDRDYVARYSRRLAQGQRVISWEAVEHPDAPVVNGVVRLTEFAGEWRLEAVGGHTRVWYVWHADPAGDFPDWALPQAFKNTGHEVLLDLAGAAGGRLLPPDAGG
jgi:hypothetical protein